MKQERVRTKRGFKGVGTFILGWFIGLISTFGILFGAGYWAYSSISVKKVEKWTKTDITDNKGLEELTLKKTVAIIQGIASNDSDAYTLAKMEEDFNIKLLDDSIYGIKLDIIKNSSFKELSQALDDTIDTVTFNNVLSFMDMGQNDLGLLDTILDTEYTYYIDNGKLYTDEKCSIEVNFAYTINEDENIVEFGNGTHTILLNTNTINARFRDLPLTYAMGSLEDAAKKLKIYEILDFERTGVEGNYTYTDNGEPVSGIMANLAEYTIEELTGEDTFNNIYIYEVMGYKREGEEGSYTYTKDGEEVTGVMKALAGKTIGQLSSDETINGIYIYEVMDYIPTGNGNYTYKDSNNQDKPVTGVMKAIAGKTIKQLSDPNTINGLYIYEVMGYERSGDEGSYTYTYNGEEVTGAMKALAGKTISEVSNPDTINNMYLYEVMGYTPVTGGGYTYVNDQDQTVEVTGAMKALAGNTIKQLSDPSTINNLQIYEIMGYTREGTAGNYVYKDNNIEVTGFMKAIAGTTISEIDTTINNLKAVDVLDEETAILNLFTSDELNGTNGKTAVTMIGLPDAVVDKINDPATTIGVLIDAGVLEVTDDNGDPVTVNTTIRDMTVSALIQYVMSRM